MYGSEFLGSFLGSLKREKLEEVAPGEKSILTIGDFAISFHFRGPRIEIRRGLRGLRIATFVKENGGLVARYWIDHPKYGDTYLFTVREDEGGRQGISFEKNQEKIEREILEEDLVPWLAGGDRKLVTNMMEAAKGKKRLDFQATFETGTDGSGKESLGQIIDLCASDRETEALIILGRTDGKIAIFEDIIAENTS